jgi:hypothetical protein
MRFAYLVLHFVFCSPVFAKTESIVEKAVEKAVEKSVLSEMQRKDCPNLNGKWTGTCDDPTSQRLKLSLQTITIVQEAGQCASMQLENSKIRVGGMTQEVDVSEVGTHHETTFAYWNPSRSGLEIHGVYAFNGSGTALMRYGTFTQTLKQDGDKLTSKRISTSTDLKKGKALPNQTSLNCNFTLVK